MAVEEVVACLHNFGCSTAEPTSADEIPLF